MARKKREFITPDLTPLIDVVFLLLIFFLVSSVFKKDQSILEINLPVAESSGASKKRKEKEINIEISKDALALNGKKVEITKLFDEIKNFDKKVMVNIKADEASTYKSLVSVLDILQRQKKENISLITDKKTLNRN